MAFGNVIPIDAGAAQQLARRHVRFRRLVVGLAAAWAALLVPTLIFAPLPPVTTFLILAAMVILAEHRFVLFGDETSMSASIIVIVASIFVFADSSPLAGPMLIASLGGIYLPHLRHRNWSLSLANLSIFGLAAAIAASITCGARPGSAAGPASLVGLSLLASVAYWYPNSVLTGCASAARNDTSMSKSVRTQAASEWPSLLLTTAAGLVALASVGHLFTLVIGLVLVLLVFEIRNARRGASHGPMVLRTSGALLVATAALLASTGVLSAAVAVTAAFLFVAEEVFMLGRSSSKLAMVLVAIALAFFMESVSVPLAYRFVAVLLAAFLTITAVEISLRRRRSGVRLPLLVTLGLAIPTRTEAALAALPSALLLVGGDRLSRLVGLAVVAGCGAAWPQFVGHHSSTDLRSSVAASR